jgi:uncharacterized protein YbjT (DUF2867 family)
MSAPSILVTGAAGLSGTLITRALARAGLPVRALVRDRARAAAIDGLPGVTLVVGDMARAETLGSALDGVARTLMISTADEGMVETQCTFVDAARAAGVQHLVKLSGAESGVGFDPRRFRYTRMHEEVERYVEASGLAWTHLRPSQFMQVYLREARAIASDRALYLPMGDARLSPIDLEDVARVSLVLLRDGGHEGHSYAMTGPESLSMHDIAERISTAIGTTVRYVDVDPAEKRRALLAAGVPGDRVDGLDELFAERRRAHESRVSLETHAIFGVRPTTFAEFAVRNAAAFRGEGVPPSGHPR